MICLENIVILRKIIKQSEIMKQGNVIMTKYKKTITTTTSTSASFIRRTLVFLAFFLMSQGFAVAQTVTTTITRYVVADDGANNGNPYTATFYSTGTDNEIWNSIKSAFTDVNKTLTDDNCFVRWDVKKSDGTYANPEAYNLSSGRVRFFFNGVGGDEYRTQGLIYEEKQYIYTHGNLPSDTYGLNTKLNATVNFGTNVFQLGSTLECYITDDGPSSNSEPENGYVVKVEIIFNENGLPPYALINETDIAATKTVVPYTTYKANNGVFDVSDALVSGAKYARIYLEKYGNANAQSGNLTITYDGNPITQCATGNEKYGWYLSEAGGIDVSKLNVTGLTADEMMKYNLIN